MRFYPLLLLLLAGCWSLRSSTGGGQTRFSGERPVRAEDMKVPKGYRVEKVADGLTFPTGVAFDYQNRAYVVESGYSYGELWTKPRLLRLEDRAVVAEGGKNGPWTGVDFRDGYFYVAEGGVLEGGAILKISSGGAVSKLVEGLPSHGDHHTNGPVFGPDGWLYFGQGTATNSGVVGEDNQQFGWLGRMPRFRDVPCRTVTLTGENFEAGGKLTGAFVPFGTRTSPGQQVEGAVPCSGAVMKLQPETGKPQLVAWGFRNPFGLAFSPDGRLYVSDNGYDERGSRPVWGAGDPLWAVQEDGWHGWPDYSEGAALPGQKPLLREPPGKPPRPAAVLGVHASATGLDFSRSERFGNVGRAYVALFGDQAPQVGKVMRPSGFRVVSVDVRTGVVEEFAGGGPASFHGHGGLERPVAARFDRDGDALYIVDFGVMTMTKDGAQPRERTGVVWKVTRDPSVPLVAASWSAEGRRGETVFFENCHKCHPNGRAGLGPALVDKPLPSFMMRLQTRKGLGKMPAFGPERISDRQLDDLLAYIKELRGRWKEEK